MSGAGAGGEAGRDLAAFRRLLKGHRGARRWSQDRLAEEAEMDHSLVSRLEGGSRTPTPEAVAKLCGGLGLGRADADDLWLAAGLLPPGLDEGTLREAVGLARALSAAELRLAGEFVALVRTGVSVQMVAGVASQAKGG